MDDIKISLSKVAEFIDGSLNGSDIVVTGLSTPELQREGTVCFISSDKNIPLMNGVATAYIVDEKFAITTDKPYITVANTRVALVKILTMLDAKPPIKHNIAKFTDIHKKAKISKPVNIANFVEVGSGSIVGSGTKIYANSVIGKNVKIGENCIIYPNVTIYDNCEIGNNVILHAGVVIGADGFGFIPSSNPTKIPHIGKVIVEDYVEIGANTTVDRGTIDSTIISFGTKLDNLIAIGHNVTIGKACLIASQTGIAGSSTLGDNVICAGQVGIGDHVTIGNGVIFGGKSGVTGEYKDAGQYLGIPALPLMKFAKSAAIFAELPELKKRVRQIEKQNIRD